MTVATFLVRVPRLYIRGDWFSVVARAMSVLLASTALVLGVAFLLVLPANGRLALGDGLTFVGFLLTAASFFATAGKPEPRGGPTIMFPEPTNVSDLLGGLKEPREPEQ